MNIKEFYNLAKNHFSFKLTAKQDLTLYKLSEFILNDDDNSLFILKGYAGTGKTTILSAIINNLWKIKKSGVLMAPTGRAAQVLAKYSKRAASTIHRKIYWIRTNKSGNTFITRKEHTHTNTIFFVDEASMIGNQPYTEEERKESEVIFEDGELLNDLLRNINEKSLKNKITIQYTYLSSRV